MNLYTSLTLRYLKQNKKRTIVTIIGIILSTALICGIGNIYESFADYQRRETIKREGAFHAVIKGVKVENLDYITKASGVEKSGLTSSLGYSKLNENDKYLVQVRQYNKVAFEGYQISLKEGRLPKNYNEIVLSENTLILAENSYKVGDEITLNIGNRVSENGDLNDYSSLEENEQIKDSKKHTFKIVGIMNRPGFEYNNTGISNAITYLNLSQVKNNAVNVSISVKNPKEIYKLVPKLAENAKVDTKIVEGTENDTVPYYENITYKEHLLRIEGASKYSSVDSTINGMIILVTSLVVICTIATVYNSFSISISERKKQFGVLNSIGATNTQIIKLVLVEGFIISIIAIPIGLLSGTVAMDILFKVVNSLFANSMVSELNLRVVYSPLIIIISTIVVLLTIFVSALFPAISASKTSPLDAIRNSSNYKIGKVKDSRLIKKIFKTEGVLAYKNLRRNKKKFRITLFSLIISVVIFVSFSGFIKILLKAEGIRSGQLTYDIVMSCITDGEDNSTKIKEEIDKIPGVKNYALQSYNDEFFTMDISEDKINKEAKGFIEGIIEKENKDNKNVYNLINNGIKVPGDKAIENLKLKEGRFDKETAIKENGVIIVNKNIYEAPGKRAEYNLTNYKVGDTIEGNINYYDNQTGEDVNIPTKFKVMGISEDLLPGEFGYRSMGLNIITYDEVLEKNGKNNIATKYYIETDKKEETKKNLEKISKRYNLNYIDEEKQSESMRDSYTVIQIFVYGFIVVISLVSITNIVNTISTNINLRKRELAIIQSIGVTPQGFNKMIYLESFLYGALALIYGIPLGIIPIVIMNKIVGQTIAFGLTLPYEAIIISVVGIFIITFISSYIPMKKINKENIIDNIRSESI